MFVEEVRRLAAKKELTASETEVVKKAALVAALASNHSWKTFKYLNNYSELDKDALQSEFEFANKEGWRRIGENDVEEVINCNFNPYALSMWFHYAVGDKSKEYNAILGKVKKELAYGVDTIKKPV